MKHLQSLPAIKTRSAKRVGRGYGSGKGSHTSTRGTKGQTSRGNGKVALWFEGGQLPLIKRLPMLRGKGRLKSLNNVATITLSQLNKFAGQEVNFETLREAKLISKKAYSVKVVANGELKNKVTVSGLAVSEAAKQAIEKAGGSVK